MLKSKKIFLISIVASLFLNNWLLGLIFNRGLLLHGGSVSELSALTMPHGWIFRFLDVATGILLGAASFILYKANNQWSYWPWIYRLTFLLGLASIVDALLPLPCSSTMDADCSAPVKFNFHEISFPHHLYSSVVIGTCFLLLPAVGYYYGRYRDSWVLKVSSLVTFALTIIFLGCLLADSLSSGALAEKLAGYSQDIQMLAFGTWLCLMAWFLQRTIEK